jgi:hypothetical protein
MIWKDKWKNKKTALYAGNSLKWGRRLKYWIDADICIIVDALISGWGRKQHALLIDKYVKLYGEVRFIERGT